MAKSLGVSLLVVQACLMAVARALPPKTLQLDLTRVVNQTAYGVQMDIGTPPQTMRVNIDTGSPFLGLAGTRSNWCTLPTKPCTEYGSYDNTTSSTAQYVSGDFNNALINHGYGDYIRDTVRVGGQTYSNIPFGMILDYAASFPAPSTIPGLIGLVPFCDENDTCGGAPVTLQQILIQQGLIGKHTLGVYLGPDDPTATGQVLFGAVDRAKQLGPAVTFPVIALSNPIANSSPNLVNFSSMAVEQSTGGAPATTKPLAIAAGSYGILDTGNPTWSLPTAAWTFAQQYFSLPTANPAQQYYPVDCKFRTAQPDGAALLVGFDADRVRIRVPMERLVTELAPGKCATAINACGSTGQGCAFGDPFLRSTYTAFDFDALTVTLSNVNYTNETDVVAS